MVYNFAIQTIPVSRPFAEMDTVKQTGYTEHSKGARRIQNLPMEGRGQGRRTS